jgi:hypothetical protein
MQIKLLDSCEVDSVQRSERSVLSANLYTAFAEQGVGCPGLLLCHSAIHSRRLLGPDLIGTSPCVAFVTLILFWPSENWAGRDTDEDITICEDELNEEERGAKTMVSV